MPPGKKQLANPPSGTGVQPPARPPEPDRVWLSLERKYRVAEYESLTVALGATSSLEPDEDLRAAAKRVFGQLRAEFGDVVDVMRAQEGI
jgi:hypothetical protein